MHQIRALGLLTVVALLAVACGGSTATPPPAASGPASEVPSVASASPVAEAPSTGPTALPTVGPGGPVTISWFCCLGGGDEESQQKTFKELATAFEATPPEHQGQDRPHGRTRAPATRSRSSSRRGTRPTSSGRWASAAPPAFEGQWLDLQPYVDKNNVDLTGYDPTLLQLYKPEGQGLVGIPFAIYPSELYYQPDMFDEAGLEYPPASYGEQYKMPDGTMVDWNYDTVRQIAMLLTIDKSGKNATEAGFDPQQDRPVRLRAAARRPAHDRGRLLQPGAARSPTTARRRRSPTPGARRGTGSTTGSGRTTSSCPTRSTRPPRSWAATTPSTRARSR